MLAGDFFESNERYNKVFDLLENPGDFERYKRLFIDRAPYQELSCQTPWDVAFGGQRLAGSVSS